MMNTQTPPVYVGVDIAKATLQVHLNGVQSAVDNTPAGRAQLCQKLQAMPHIQVVCEATGGYEQALVLDLQTARIPVSVVNPAQVRAAAQAKGQRAKTDAIDAQRLTEYGQRYQPEPTPPLSAVQRQLAALTQWLRQLVEAQAVAKTQTEHHTEPFVCQQHQALLEHFQGQIQATEAQLQTLLEQDQQLRERAECLDAIEGVGRRTALMVLCHLPELGLLNRREVAALAGLAPWTRESGAMKGVRCIGGGRPELRVAIYMSSLSAIRVNPVLKPFYARLIAKGKPGKVALTAVMRKLVVHMNYRLKALATQGAGAATQKEAA